MRDSGRQIGDCKHGNIRETCRECVWEYAMTHRDTRPRYRIKRLEWKKGNNYASAETPFGRIFAKKYIVYLHAQFRDCANLEDGKRVAQEWFEELMREGLEQT